MKFIFSEIILVLIIFFQLFLPNKCSDVILLDLLYNYNKNIDSPSIIYLYTISHLASPKMDIYTYIRSDKKQNLFSIYELVSRSIDSEKINNYYNYSKSKTFQNVSRLGKTYIQSVNDIHARENFFFNVYNNKTKTNKEIEVSELNFVLGVDLFHNNRMFFLNIGFPVVNEQTLGDRFKFDLIMQLKQRKIIDGYDWFILLEDKYDKGDDVIKAEDLSKLNPKIVIGTLPHYYNSDKYYQSQLLKTYSDLYFWSITFKDIYLYIHSSTGEKKKTSTFVEVVEFYLDDIMIYGPMYYLTIIKSQYFSKYSSCYSEKNPELIFYCEKSANFGINELKLFPKLYLDNVDLNYTFELTYKELFIEINGKYYFLITENSDETWSIGFSLFKKYQFVFNQDSRTVGFYNPNLPKEKEEKEEQSDTDVKEEEEEKEEQKANKEEEKENNENNIKESGLSIELVIIILCIGGIIFIAIGILIGKFIFKKMKGKKRMNELDENFDYFSSQENAINE